MATLEDKILGEKTHYYCSSSDSSAEESNDELENETEGATAKTITTTSEPKDVEKWNGVSSNTGPKGVIKDWQKFKQLEIRKMHEQQKEKVNLIKEKALTCKSTREEEAEMAELQKEFEELLSDNKFLQQYRKQRMNEMLSNSSKLPSFGKLIHLGNGDEFLKALDDEHKAVTVIVHIYEDNVPGCKRMNKCLLEVSNEYPRVKFCKLVGSSAGMSSHFKSDGVPALLVYKAGQMVGNFVRVTDELGDEFYAGDVENYLIEHGMINDKSCVPKIISQVEANSDSDG